MSLRSEEMSAVSEAHIEHELYRIFKDAIIDGIKVDNYSVLDIAPQFRAAEGKADLVVTLEAPYARKEVLLVIEAKGRPKTVKPYKTGVVQATRYAEELRAWFFAVCDGWFMLLFKTVVNKLVGAYGVEMSKGYARNLLAGLIEYRGKDKSEYLKKLPKAPNSFYLRQKLFPLLTKIGIRDLE